MEVELDTRKMELIRHRLGFMGCLTVGAIGRNDGLALLWCTKDLVEVWNYSHNHILVWVIDPQVQSRWFLTSFYGEPDTSKKKRI